MSHEETKTDFCRSLAWTRDITWSGQTGLSKLDADRLAKIELTISGVIGEYPGFRVTILNKREGTVDSTYFRFDDHLDRSLRGRTDGRGDYPLGGNSTYKVISHCGWHWYIANPQTTAPFVEAVETYIEAFV